MRPARPKIERRPLHGVLLLDKPLGLSSNDALQKAKRLLRAEKAGHTGTLDPLASGLLPLCFGAATKFSQVSLDADKRYRATLALGVTTSTADGEGEVLQRRPADFSPAQLDAALAAHRGPLRQVPPMHSALKHAGRALYDYARAGIEIERAPRDITIHALDVVEACLDAELPTLVLDVCCSKGTYVRTLAETLGEMLGCGAYLSALRRTASGPLDVADAITLDALEALDEPGRVARLLPPDRLLADWPALQLDADEAGRFLTGLRRRVARADCAQLRVYGPASVASPDADAPATLVRPASAAPARVLLGMGHVSAGELIADRLLSPPEVAGLMQQAAARIAPNPPIPASSVAVPESA